MTRAPLPDPAYQDLNDYRAGIASAIAGAPRERPRGASVWWDRGWDVQSAERLLDEVLAVKRA